MKRLLKTIFLFLCLGALLAWPVFAVTEDAEDAPDGLVQLENGLYYYEDGIPFCGGLKEVIDSTGDPVYYYFQADGRAYHEGVLKLTDEDGKAVYYYFQSNCKAYTSGYKGTNTYAEANADCVVTKSSDQTARRYYFQSNGQAYTKGYLQFTHTNGKSYNFFFQSNGTALTDSWQTVDGGHYYFGSNGQGLKGWQTISGSKYYFDSDSKALTGKQTVGNYLCYFDDNGALTRSINKNGKMVAVTYDDGPSQYTGTILDVLEQNDAVATFFVVGSRVSDYASTAKREISLGCEIGNHTYDHVNLTKKSTSEIKSQVSKTNDAVKKAAGVTPVILRPPGGNFNNTVKSTVGMPLIYWSIDTRDWEHRNAQTTINNVLNNVRDGDIILMHDLYSSTADAAKTIIPTLINRGYQLVTVSELAECRGGMKNGIVYYNFRNT